ncbi:SLATT domain-containing protein [Acinetobacter soli]|uniref:SLATT domain-containing protein n=1 Tax=Acinetobacter soli TaxID=487316 RepID=UPI00124F9362|nr:SLATT domain-containing protein [Acinetobacter soli]MEB4799957.1 SLATT domain-containing protein [Acinetobacter soli]
MTKNQLLNEIASSGYSTSYGKDKCYSTYDLANKTITRVGLGLLVLSIFMLGYQNLNGFISLAIAGVVGGVLLMYMEKYNDSKYVTIASQLQDIERDLKQLYYDVQNTSSNQSLSTYEQQWVTLDNQQKNLAIEKQIFGSDWYAHVKMFWTKKINTQWYVDELELKFFFDKLPFSFFSTCLVIFILILLLLIGLFIANYLIDQGLALTYLELFKGICK